MLTILEHQIKSSSNYHTDSIESVHRIAYILYPINCFNKPLKLNQF